ncbi:hypothetical protein CU097_003066 [Rhizopus azygosporus]|uniref:Uncharacterized protein n=3 Tax=Rhizopus TaxID=4842 RepID=A0A367JP86_RHIAZ|nr:hypothetical protein BCV72DRAFT_214482 [Rhizopus microsporus var. microsporus]RCH91780.1 hypothetical protein CU097_003066 [Rhizopus azygosporus]CEG77731.1 hypothetical protein RMATCC62417_12430 [Rhizopus microsporus]CEI93735.1 hypothetical protein RMCBS344292_07963 [Rhizopus microsporus]
MNRTKQLATKIYRSPVVCSKNIINQRCMSAFSHMSDNDPETLEREKQKHLSKKEKEWNEKLASTSEANVKADKEQDIPIQELQNKTVDHHAKNRTDKESL